MDGSENVEKLYTKTMKAAAGAETQWRGSREGVEEGRAATVAGNGTRPLYRLQSCRWRRLLLFGCPKQATRGRGREVSGGWKAARVVAARCSPKWRRVDNTIQGYNSCCSHCPGECTLDMQTRQRWGQNYRNYVSSALCYLGNSAQLDSFGLRPRPSSGSCSFPSLSRLPLKWFALFVPSCNVNSWAMNKIWISIWDTIMVHIQFSKGARGC